LKSIKMTIDFILLVTVDLKNKLYSHKTKNVVKDKNQVNL